MDLIIKDVKLEADLMDVDFMEKFEAGMRRMRDTAVASKDVTYKSVAESYRAQCNLIDSCLDEIFGDGTAKRLFGGKMNVMDHLQAIETVNKWAASERKILNDFTNRYTQRQNSRSGAQFVAPAATPGKKHRR